MVSFSPAHTLFRARPQKFLVYGKTGWIGQQIGDCLRDRNVDFVYGNARLEFLKDIAKEIEAVRVVIKR